MCIFSTQNIVYNSFLKLTALSARTYEEISFRVICAMSKFNLSLPLSTTLSKLGLIVFNIYSHMN